MIDVPKKEIQRLDALLDAAIDRTPIGGCDHARDHIERQYAVDRGSVAIDRESNTEGIQLPFRIFRPLAELLKLELLKAMPKSRQMAVTVFD